MDRGLDAQLIAWSTAFDAVCAGISTFTVGSLVKKIGIRILGTISFLFLAFASLITIYATDDPFFVYFPMTLTHRPLEPTPDSEEFAIFDPPSNQTLGGKTWNELEGWADDAKYYKDILILL